MFEPNMDEYLDEEIESAKQAFETICKEWERQVCTLFLMIDSFSEPFPTVVRGNSYSGRRSLSLLE